MTAHTHTTLVEGCFRCELSRDEMAAIEAENEKALAAVMRRALEHADLLRGLRKTVDGEDPPHRIAFRPDTVIELTEDEFDILTEIQDFPSDD